jgi:very-short-patch-repair endonuclease
MYDNEKRSNYFYDFCITSLKLIIEFDGTYWHSLEGAKEKDQHKQKVVEEKGFTMIRIDESDYNKDKQSIVDVCINKILEMFESTNNCEMFEIKEGELV